MISGYIFNTNDALLSMIILLKNVDFVVNHENMSRTTFRRDYCKCSTKRGVLQNSFSTKYQTGLCSKSLQNTFEEVRFDHRDLTKAYELQLH